MPYRKDNIISVLENKFGFSKVRNSGRNKHDRYAFYHDGKKIATTGFSRGARKNSNIDPALLTMMAREIRVQTLGFFRGMIDCPISLEEYLERLRNQGFIR